MALLVLISTPLVAALVSLVVRRTVRPLELITALAAPVELAAVVYAAIAVFNDGCLRVWFLSFPGCAGHWLSC